MGFHMISFATATAQSMSLNSMIQAKSYIQNLPSFAPLSPRLQSAGKATADKSLSWRWQR
jgi:hypothetical protein